MIPHDCKKPQINPRKLFLDGHETELYALICQTGYVPEEQNFSDFCQSLKSGRGWLISGTRGSGKTAFPEALATVCNLTICIVAGRDGLKQEEILYDWDKEEQVAWMNENLRLAKDASENEREEIMMLARAEKWKREFLILGEMGLAYDLAAKAMTNNENLAPPLSESRRITPTQMPFIKKVFASFMTRTITLTLKDMVLRWRRRGIIKSALPPLFHPTYTTKKLNCRSVTRTKKRTMIRRKNL